MLSKRLLQSVGKVRGNVKHIRFSTVNRFAWTSASEPIESATTPPSSWYTDPTFLNIVENKYTFNDWLLACHFTDVKHDGDYFSTTINNQPIVVVNSQGNLKAFYNICRHHAAKICDDGPGKLGINGRFKCPYHGWQYNTDGKLVKAVSMKGCKDFSPKQFGLHSVTLDRLGPWVYINLNGGNKINETEQRKLLTDCPDLSKMHDMLSKTGYEDLVKVRSHSYTLKCNWKVFVDNYLDGGYHVPVAHPDLSSSLEFSTYKREGFDNFYLQSCAASKSTDTNSTNGDKDNANTRISGGDACNKEALYMFQYPNIMINRYGQWMDTNIVWPRGPDECVVDFVWYADATYLQSLSPEALKDNMDQSEQVQIEDIWLCERVQKGLQSNGYEVGRYAPTMEGGEYMFHQKLHQDYLKSELAK